MGYYGQMTQFELYIVASEIVMVQVILSVLWLRYYNTGPAEWLLRRLSYGFKKKELHVSNPSPNSSLP
jgi:uncharacterized protein